MQGEKEVKDRLREGGKGRNGGYEDVRKEKDKGRVDEEVKGCKM